MRLSSLLFIGLIPLYSLSQPLLMEHLLHEHPYDTLDRYSYLIISLDRNAKKGDVATGFFYKTPDKLYLVSAYHLFSGFNVLTRSFSDVRPDSLVVWYWDKSDSLKTARLPLRKHNRKKRPRILRLSDVDMMDVTSYFGKGQVNSIEDMVGTDRSFNQVVTDDTVVAYGFPHVSQSTIDSLNKGLMVSPKGYICKAVDTPKDQRTGRNWDLPSVYRYIHPPLQKGVSGAPVFRVKKDNADRKTVEFMGIQSFSSTDSTNSMIVNESEMIKLLGYLNRKRSTLNTLRIR